MPSAWLRRATAAGALCCGLLAGCTQLATAPPAVTLAEIPEVGFFPQERFQCGPAALATLLDWAGQPVAPAALETQLYLENRRGSLQVELLAAARRAGVLPYLHSGGFSDLWALLESGQPALVLQNLALSWYPKWHYAVVVGFDAEREEVLLRSGRERLKRESLQHFAQTWQGGDQWLLSLAPRGAIPAGAAELEFLSAAHDLEATGQALAARSYFQAATGQWPASMTAWMALGNNYYNAGLYPQAETAFREALEAQPTHPAPPHNLAWALLKQGHTAGARTYAEQAVALSNVLPAAERERYSAAARVLGRGDTGP